MPTRVTFLVDGFNVYHSIKDAIGRTGIRNLRWLDLRGLCDSYIHHFGRDARLEEVLYFSAYAKHLIERKPDVVNRHRTYIEALESTGVRTHLARFKQKERRCSHCRNTFIQNEEKETDVWIACALFELLVGDACDHAVLVSGDTDLAPAIRSARRMFSQKQVSVVFPYGRVNNELKPLADIYFQIKPPQYAKHQLPDPITLQTGRVLSKPASW